MVFKVPDAYLNEYADRLKDQFNIKVSTSLLSRFFASKDISRKKVFNLLFIY